MELHPLGGTKGQDLKHEWRDHSQTADQKEEVGVGTDVGKRLREWSCVFTKITQASLI